MRIRSFHAALLVPLIMATPSRATDDDLATVVRTIDEMFRSTSSHTIVEMQIVTPDWERTLEMEMWTLGMDRTFVRILSPRKEKGVGTLRIDKEMWMRIQNGKEKKCDEKNLCAHQKTT